MIQIRRNIFETNSSSTHSITVTHGVDLAAPSLPISSDGYIHITLDGYGWDRRDYIDQASRLSYLVTMLSAILGQDLWCISSDELKIGIKNLQQSEEFQLISNEIASYTGAKGLIIDESEGYIDHQSVHYKSFANYLDYWDVSILEFVFGDTVVRTDNDNGYDYY